MGTPFLEARELSDDCRGGHNVAVLQHPADGPAHWAMSWLRLLFKFFNMMVGGWGVGEGSFFPPTESK